MTSAVLDTNVLASGFVRRNPASAVAQIVDAWLAGRFILVISEHILEELAETLAQPYFGQHITKDQANGLLDLLRGQATLIAITAVVNGVATHPEDDLILATALSANADYLVTGDAKLQKLRRYEAVRIVSPREFMAVLAEE